jgi:hypothetical protein
MCHNEVLEPWDRKMCIDGMVEQGKARFVGWTCLTDGQSEGKRLRQHC